MNNFYRLLSVNSEADVQTLNDRLDALAVNSPELAENIALIFSNQKAKSEYDKLHGQYEALAVAFQSLADLMPSDTGNWSSRLSEFPVREL